MLEAVSEESSSHSASDSMRNMIEHQPKRQSQFRRDSKVTPDSTCHKLVKFLESSKDEPKYKKIVITKARSLGFLSVYDGSIKLICLKTFNILTTFNSSRFHEESLLTIDTNDEYLASSLENNIKVWSIKNLIQDHKETQNLTDRVSNRSMSYNRSSPQPVPSHVGYFDGETNCIIDDSSNDVPITSIEFGANGIWILIGLENGVVKVIDISLRWYIHEFRDNPDAPISHIRCSLDGKWVLCGNVNGGLKKFSLMQRIKSKWKLDKNDCWTNLKVLDYMAVYGIDTKNTQNTKKITMINQINESKNK